LKYWDAAGEPTAILGNAVRKNRMEMASGELNRREFLQATIAAPAAATTPGSFHDFYTTAPRRNGIVGSSFLFLQEGSAPVKQFYGHSRLAGKAPLDRNTCFHWGSITKTFTGIGIIQLRDRGLATV